MITNLFRWIPIKTLAVRAVLGSSCKAPVGVLTGGTPVSDRFPTPCSLLMCLNLYLLTSHLGETQVWLWTTFTSIFQLCSESSTLGKSAHTWLRDPFVPWPMNTSLVPFLTSHISRCDSLLKNRKCSPEWHPLFSYLPNILLPADKCLSSHIPSKYVLGKAQSLT